VFGLTGKLALVTGARRGIGLAMAEALAGAGADIIGVSLNLDTGPSEVRRRVEAAGRTFTGYRVDLSRREEVSELAGTIAALDRPLDILVNNAGIAATTSFLAQDEAEWRGVLATNLDGAWRVAHTVASRMAAQGRGGAIVNIASILGLRPASHVAAYAAAKAGLISLTQSMAIELARYAIRVNALAPGYVETDLNRDFLRGPAGQAMAKRVPLRRFGDAADLDGALLLLVSDAGRYMTGSVVVVDGGHSLGIA
jgi:NAD(P)-dependent dehydrogenase (short-subunit alcohol dehydrogenase family)